MYLRRRAPPNRQRPISPAEAPAAPAGQVVVRGLRAGIADGAGAPPTVVAGPSAARAGRAALPRVIKAAKSAAARAARRVNLLRDSDPNHPILPSSPGRTALAGNISRILPVA